MNALRSFSDEKFGIKWDQKEKEWLRGLMHEGIVIVEFLKSDGSVRKMTATLSEQKIPSEKAPKNVGKAKNDEILAVFDLEKSEWRSFRFDSVRSIQFEV